MYNQNILVLNSMTSVAAGGNVVGEAPCVGRPVLGVFVYADTQIVNLEVSEGVNDYTGVLIYRDTVIFPVAVGTAFRLIRDLTGKFVRVRAVNTGAAASIIEIYAELRLK